MRAQAYERLDTALPRLQGAHCDTLPVLDHGALVGMLRLENVGELVAIRSTMRHGQSTGLAG